MRLSLILIMVLVVVFGMISCDRQRAVDEKKLSLAEELMPDNPDSAYKLLNDILFPENMDAGKRAGYARLYAESASASDKSFSSDTLLKSAADYYISVGDSVSAASSMKYEGIRLRYIGDMQGAISSVEKAIEFVPDSINSNRYNLYNLLVQMALLANLTDVAKEYSAKMMESSDPGVAALGHYNIGVAYSWETNRSSDETISDSAFYHIEKSVEIATKGNCELLHHYLRNSINYRLPEDELLRRLSRVEELGRPSSNVYAGIAQVFLAFRQPDSARVYLDKAESAYQEEWSKWGLEYVSIRNELGVLRSVLNYLDGMRDFSALPASFNDSVYFAGERYKLLSEDILTNRDRNNARDMVRIKRQHTLTMISIVLIFVMIISAGALRLYAVRKRQKLVDAEEKMETLERLLAESEGQKEGGGSADDALFRKLLLQQLGVIRLIAGTPTDANRELLRQVSRLEWNEKDFEGLLNWTDLYPVIDSAYDSFYTRLQEKYGDVLNEREIQLACLLRAGFSTKEISVVVGQSTRTIYQRKTEIRKKLMLDEGADIAMEITSRING